MFSPAWIMVIPEIVVGFILASGVHMPPCVASEGYRAARNAGTDRSRNTCANANDHQYAASLNVSASDSNTIECAAVLKFLCR
jgi:hypothetical protein